MESISSFCLYATTLLILPQKDLTERATFAATRRMRSASSFSFLSARASACRWYVSIALEIFFARAWCRFFSDLKSSDIHSISFSRKSQCVVLRS